MTIRIIVLILIAKLVSFVSKSLSLGNGSTWPGHIALATNKSFLSKLIIKNKKLKIILVAGTNGKTTTAKILQQILDGQHIKSFRNESGANLLNGITSSLILHASVTGNIEYDAAIFETDESTLSLVLKEVTPHAVILLNLFRDQLDRYGEVNTIAANWKNSLQNLPKDSFVFINGDDPQLVFIGEKLQATVSYFGIPEDAMQRKVIPHDVDSIYCPVCQTKLAYSSLSYSHLGKFQCPNCNFSNGKEIFSTVQNPLHGLYNQYNVQAALLTASYVFKLSEDKIKKAISSFNPAFGRQEMLSQNGKQAVLLLSKNPTGFNQSIDSLPEFGKKGPVLAILNDRIPDGRDVSWIWDVDFENLLKFSETIVVSGDRTYDLALRMKHCFKMEQEPQVSQKNGKHKIEKNIHVVEDLSEALDTGFGLIKSGEMLFILATYSAMLETRKILTGKKIL